MNYIYCYTNSQRSISDVRARASKVNKRKFVKGPKGLCLEEDPRRVRAGSKTKRFKIRLKNVLNYTPPAVASVRKNIVSGKTRQRFVTGPSAAAAAVASSRATYRFGRRNYR